VIVALVLAVPLLVGVLAFRSLVNADSGRSAFTYVTVTSMDGSDPCFEFQNETFCVSSSEIQRMEPGHAVKAGDCLDVEFSENKKVRSIGWRGRCGM
jgi:hypothetical protein